MGTTAKQFDASDHTRIAVVMTKVSDGMFAECIFTKENDDERKN